MNKIAIEMTACEGYVKPDLVGGRALVDALRSGKYKKGKGFLCYIDKKGEYDYCCLGIKCELDGILRPVCNDTVYRLAVTPVGGSNTKSLPEGHDWRDKFGSDLGFPDGFSLNVIDSKGFSKPRRIITAVNDFCDRDGGEFSFNTIAIILETAWNCI